MAKAGNSGTATVTTVTTTHTAANYPLSSSGNLLWPTDIYGFTTGLKKEFLRCATRVGKAADKKALFDAVVALGIDHVTDKYNEKAGI